MTIKVIMNGNAIARGNRNLERLMRQKFCGSLTDLERTAFPGHATEIARQAVRDGFDTIVAVGGDGTVNEVLNGIAGSDVALGIIPLGTANDLAMCLGIPTGCELACDVIRDGCLRPIDVIKCSDALPFPPMRRGEQTGKATQRYFVTTGGIGLPCEIAGIVNRIKSRKSLGGRFGLVFSHNLYVAAAFLAIARKWKHRNLLTIRNNGNSTTVDAQSVLISNQPLLGRRFLISPCARNDDGRFDVTVIRNTKAWLRDLLVVLKVLSGTPDSIASVDRWKARELTVEADTPIAFLGDGEVFQVGSKVRIEILPHALNVIVPRSHTMCRSRDLSALAESGNPGLFPLYASRGEHKGGCLSVSLPPKACHSRRESE